MSRRPGDPIDRGTPITLDDAFEARPMRGALPDRVFQLRGPRPATDPPPRAPAPPPPAPGRELPEPGAILDKYRIEEPVGSGGFAVVFRARHILLDMPVAVKLLRPEVVRRRPDLAAALCDEARLAARINHANVVRVFDVAHTPALTYIVMEFVEGVALNELVRRRGPLRGSKLLRVGIAVALGLRAGLAGGVIHRDVKPANIVITSDGATKLVDLGLGTRVPDDAADGLSTRAVVGTPGYMAPEQASQPAAVDFRADIYALGATLYFAATGAAPFPTGDPDRCLELHARAPVPPPRARAPALSPAIEDLLLWMLAKRPGQRPDSYEILIAAMRRALDAEPT